MAGSEVVAWYKQSVGFGWQAVIRNQASASNPIPQADCYLSPPFNSCKLCLLSVGGGGCMCISSCAGCEFVNTILPWPVHVCKLGHMSSLYWCRLGAAAQW